MLVSATEMLDKAKAGHYAVGQFNINNLEWTKSILLTAQELKSPVILGVSEGAGKYMTGFKTVAAMVKAMDEELGITVPVALHLDHGTYEGCYKCIKAGFTSIMFDGSHYPIEENVEKTKELVKIAHEKNMSIEAEVGSIGVEEDGVIGKGECADPQECKMVSDLGIDFLAAGIGNIHGNRHNGFTALLADPVAVAAVHGRFIVGHGCALFRGEPGGRERHSATGTDRHKFHLVLVGEVLDGAAHFRGKVDVRVLCIAAQDTGHGTDLRVQILLRSTIIIVLHDVDECKIQHRQHQGDDPQVIDDPAACDRASGTFFCAMSAFICHSTYIHNPRSS